MLPKFCLAVLEYCSAVWCSSADTHLKLLDSVVSGAGFLTRHVFECDIAHRRSVAVLCMLNKIRCNLMHPLKDALPGPYVPVRVTVVVVVVVVGQTVGSISSKTLAYDCLCTLELCMASLIDTSLLGHLGDFLHSVCPSCS